MGRNLSVALAQYPPITGADPVRQLRGEAAEILRESSDLDLIVFPEIHLCGDSDIARNRNDWLRKIGTTPWGARAKDGGDALQLLIGGCRPAGDDTCGVLGEPFDGEGLTGLDHARVIRWIRLQTARQLRAVMGDGGR